jgi:hypothetical protein
VISPNATTFRHWHSLAWLRLVISMSCVATYRPMSASTRLMRLFQQPDKLI